MRTFSKLVAIATVSASLGFHVNPAAAQNFDDRWSIIPKAHAALILTSHLRYREPSKQAHPKRRKGEAGLTATAAREAARSGADGAAPVDRQEGASRAVSPQIQLPRHQIKRSRNRYRSLLAQIRRFKTHKTRTPVLAFFWERLHFIPIGQERQRVAPRSTVICKQPPTEACRLARKSASRFLPPISQWLFALQTADRIFVTASSISRSGPRAIWELGIRVLSKFALRCFSIFVRKATMKGCP